MTKSLQCPKCGTQYKRMSSHLAFAKCTTPNCQGIVHRNPPRPIHDSRSATGEATYAVPKDRFPGYSIQ